MKHDFRGKIAKIIAEVHNRTCIDKIDTEILEAILQDELNEYYYDGYDDGYAAGKSSLDGDVERAYYEGFEDGRAEAESEGHDDGINTDF